MKFPQKRLSPALLSSTLFVVAALAALFSRFFHPGLLLGFYQDDFFYYLRIADNLALHGISSFDGIHRTNGYHPLWLLTLTALRLLLHGTAFFLALQALTFAAALACYAAIHRILRTLHLPDPLCSTATLLLALQALLLLRYGMEVTLALPLGLTLTALLLETPPHLTSRRTLALTLLGSLTILARLDAILLVLPLLLAALWSRKLLRSPRYLAALALGLTPVLIYLTLNHHYFGLLTPVSGHAKQLKSTLLPSPVTLLSLVHPFDRFKLIFVLPSFLLLALGLLRAPRTLPTLPRPQAATLLALLLFPILQLTLLSVLSDWVLWPWYLYTFLFSSLATVPLIAPTEVLAPIPSSSMSPQTGCPILSDSLAVGEGGVVPPKLSTPTPAQTPARLLQPVALTLTAATLLYLAAYTLLLPNSIEIYTSSSALAAWINIHPGTYAMGDQAGLTGYLSTQPILQLEGLVMDADYLHKLQHQEHLAHILADYHARFYVTLAHPNHPACLPLREPGQAGPHSPVSTGIVCTPPIATFRRNPNLLLEVFNAQDIH